MQDVSSAGSERRLDRAEVSGSNPLRPTKKGLYINMICKPLSYYP